MEGTSPVIICVPVRPFRIRESDGGTNPDINDSNYNSEDIDDEKVKISMFYWNILYLILLKWKLFLFFFFFFFLVLLLLLLFLFIWWYEYLATDIVFL